MKLPRFSSCVLIALLTLMTLYSLALFNLELRTSQDHVRHYFTDIEGPVFLYAINTTVSVCLLWATALIFSIVLLVIHRVPGAGRERRFCLSQIAIFGYLGADDRFLLHERLSDLVPLHDTLILVTIGCLEAAALAIWGDLRSRSPAARLYLLLAAILFLLMAAIDAFVPANLVLRLSCEDLTKSWAALLLFLFSWRILATHIVALKAAAR